MRLWPGNPYPLGATWDGAGVNFAIFAENATRVDLCLFDDADARQESHRIRLKEYAHDDWNAGFVKCLGVRLAGDVINDENERGEPIVGDTLLLLLNGHWEPIPFTLPETRESHLWDPILDTAHLPEDVQLLKRGRAISAPGPNLAVLVARTSKGKEELPGPSQSRDALGANIV